MWVWSVGGEDTLEEEMAIHSSILAGEFHGLRNLVGYSPVHRVAKSWTRLSSSTALTSLTRAMPLFSQAKTKEQSFMKGVPIDPLIYWK